MNLRDKCPLCLSNDTRHYLTCKDYTVSQKDFEIVTCNNCSLHYTSTVPSESEIGEYYKSEEYISHSSTDKGFINKLYQVVRKRALNKKVKLVRQYIKKDDKLADVGAGTGHFIKACNDNDIDAIGFEPDEIARKNAQEINGVNLKKLSAFEDEKNIRVLTMWHVLEHVYHLRAFIEQVQKNLTDDGVWIVAVPNMKSHDANHYEKFWAAYDVPRHLYHFSPDNIKWLCNEFGFQLEKILPMKYDSYYVSMLSEKYKKGNLLKAVWRGFVSNLKANNESYSSQIYVLKKNKI